MSADTSSEDEDLTRLKDATDLRFINDAMFKNNISSRKKSHKKKENLPSLRRSKDEDEQFNLFHVTPEFRNYVAKHLSNLLDRQLRKRIQHEDIIYKRKKCKNKIKLFSDSLNYIESDKNEVLVVKRPRGSVAEDNYEKCKSVSVTVEDVKNETSKWATRSKAPVFRYRKTSCGLVEV